MVFLVISFAFWGCTILCPLYHYYTVYTATFGLFIVSAGGGIALFVHCVGRAAVSKYVVDYFRRTSSVMSGNSFTSGVSNVTSKRIQSMMEVKSSGDEEDHRYND